MRGGKRPGAGRKPRVDSASAQSQQSKYPPSRTAGLIPWQSGQSGNPKGRVKGSRNRLGEELLSALQADFEQHGAATIVKVREERPHEYLKVVAGILPKELNVRTTAVEEMSDDELAAGIAALQSVLAAQADGKGSAEKTRH